MRSPRGSRLAIAAQQPSDRERCDVTHRKERSGRRHAFSDSRDARPMRDVGLADDAPARAQGDEYFGLEEVRLASRRCGPQLLRPVELHAVDVVHRQAEDATQQTRVELRHHLTAPATVTSSLWAGITIESWMASP